MRTPVRARARTKRTWRLTVCPGNVAVRPGGALPPDTGASLDDGTAGDKRSSDAAGAHEKAAEPWKVRALAAERLPQFARKCRRGLHGCESLVLASPAAAAGSDKLCAHKQHRMEARIAKLEERRSGNGAANPRPAISYSAAAAKAGAGRAAEASAQTSGQEGNRGPQEQALEDGAGKENEAKKKAGTLRGKTGASSYGSRRQSAVSFSEDHEVRSLHLLRLCAVSVVVGKSRCSGPSLSGSAASRVLRFTRAHHLCTHTDLRAFAY